MKISWGRNISDANKAEIEKHLNPFLFIVPKWLQKLNIELYETESEGLMAAISVKECYRDASLNIYATWLLHTDESKSEAILHELIHLHSNAIFDFSKNVIRKFAADSDENQVSIIFDEMECYLERQTQDLAFAIYERFKTENH